MFIKANQEKFNVSIYVKNSKDHAYNTEVSLSYSENINYVKVEVSSSLTTFDVVRGEREVVLF